MILSFKNLLPWTLLLLTHCSVRKFSNQPGMVAPYVKTIQPISCEMERTSDKSLSLERNAEDYQFLFDPVCPKQGKVVTPENITKSLNVVFVIDMAKHMQGNTRIIAQQITKLA